MRPNLETADQLSEVFSWIHSSLGLQHQRLGHADQGQSNLDLVTDFNRLPGTIAYSAGSVAPW
jgi:hypothetical protein